jgi:hypothetical protein
MVYTICAVLVSQTFGIFNRGCNNFLHKIPACDCSIMVHFAYIYSVTCQRVVGLCGGGTRVCNPPLSANSVNETSAQAR